MLDIGWMITVGVGIAQLDVSIIRAVFTQLSSPSNLPLWKRIAAFLSFVAVLAALIGPAAMLAEEVRTGKLGGLCLVSTPTDGSGDVTPAGSHCDSCGSLAFALPPFTAQPLPSQPGQRVAGLAFSFDLAGLVEGLPPSRGPPVL